MNTTDKPMPTDEELKALFNEKQSEYYKRPTSSLQDGRDAFAFVLDHLKPWLRDSAQSAGLPWVSLKERRPTKKDGTPSRGAVLFLEAEGDTYNTEWDCVPTNATHFLPFSPPAQPSQDDLDREAFEKEWSNVSDFTRTAHGYAVPHVNTLWNGFKSALELSRKQS